MARPRIATVSLASAFLLLSACTTYESQSFVSTQNAAIESAYITTDADFSRYDKLLARDMGIYFPPEAAPTTSDLQRTRLIFREAFIAELSEYTVVREPAPGALEVQATLVDFRNAVSTKQPGLSTELAAIAEPGAILFLMELKDPYSGKTLARAADSASTPNFATSGTTETDWTSVETAAERWAGLFRDFLDQNLNQ